MQRSALRLRLSLFTILSKTILEIPWKQVKSSWPFLPWFETKIGIFLNCLQLDMQSCQYQQLIFLKEDQGQHQVNVRKSFHGYQDVIGIFLS